MLASIWRMLGSPIHWRILWLRHDKFMLGVSGVMLNEAGEVLLLQHTFWQKGSWGLPSGYIEKSETLEAGLQREIYEETQLRVEIERLLRTVSGYRLRLEMTYQGHIVGPAEPHLDPREVLAAQFFPLDQLPDGLLPSHREVIGLVRQQRLDVVDVAAEMVEKEP